MTEISRRRMFATGLSAAAAAGAQELERSTANSRLYTFVAGNAGDWSVTSIKAVTGESLPVAKRLQVVNAPVPSLPTGGKWALRGVISNTRYTTHTEKAELEEKQSKLGRATSTRAALIPIRKRAAWWDLTQEERRHIFEESSHHIKIGLKYLPPIARRLHHCRDLSTVEPFDFVTWFDYAPEHVQAFEDLVGELRATKEWTFVEREIDIRLVRS